MKTKFLLVAGFASSCILLGCSVTPINNESMGDRDLIPILKVENYHSKNSQTSQDIELKTATNKNIEASFKKERKFYDTSKLIKIIGIGYGAASTVENMTKGQRRLMAIRASKLDAYRSLAEQLYGIKIDSNTAISTLTTKNDSFRARVNSVVRGARIVSITPMADSNYETVLEVYVDKSFFANTFIYTHDSLSRNSFGG